MLSRSETTVLVGVAIDGEVEEVGTDSAVVEQRVALARRAVAADRLAFVFGCNEKRQEPALRASHLPIERRVGRKIAEAEALLALENLRNALARLASRLRMRKIDAQ